MVWLVAMLAAIVLLAMVANPFASVVSANTEIYSEDFETDLGDWQGAIIHNPAPETATVSGSAYSFFDNGGFSSEWPEHGYIAELDVFIDPESMSSGDGFDLSVASARNDGTHLRDFIFHVGKTAAGDVLVNGSTTTSGSVNDFKLHNEGDGTPGTITASGWYTFQHVFRDAGDGSLAVDLRVLDDLGAEVFVTTLNHPADDIATIVGGHGYEWFIFATESYGIDNHVLTHVIPDSNIEISKTVDPTEVTYGAEETVTYTIQVSNDDLGFTAAAPVDAVTITDTLPTGVTYVSDTPDSPYTCDEAAGVITCVNTEAEHGVDTPANIDVEVTVDADTPLGTYTNDAEVTATSQDFDGGDAVDFEVVLGTPVIEIEKSITGDSNVFEVGDTVTYVIDVSNTGDAALPDSVDVSDTLPANLSFDETDVTEDAPYECTVSGQDVDCTNSLGQHPGGATAQITIETTLVSEDGGGLGLLNDASAELDDEEVDSDSAIFFVNLAVFDGEDGVVHLDPFGELMLDERDDENNLVGYRHDVCLIDGERVLVGDNEEWNFQGIIESLGAASGEETDLYWRIDDLSGNVSVSGQSMFTAGFDVDGNREDVDPDVEFPCVRWYSSAPGEQNITVVNGNGEVVADFNGVSDDAIVNDNPLVKEWNLLDPTAITLRDEWFTDDADHEVPAHAYDHNLDGETITAPMFHDSGADVFVSGEDIDFLEHVFGSHQSIGGPVGPIIVDGARVTFTVSGTCGMAEIDGDTTVEGNDEDIYVNGSPSSVTVTSAGVPIEFDVETNDCASPNNSYTTVTINVAYPTIIGSIGYQPPAEESITVEWERTAPTKDVWLAWVGQRVVVEADWNVGTGENAFCPFGNIAFDSTTDAQGINGPQRQSILDFFGTQFGIVQFLKSQGNGTFDPSSDVFVLGTDQAFTLIDDDCTARVIFESEDQGQVDVEGFVIGNQASKQAFVIYYMKIEDVTTSLVTGVERENHNTGDWTPGNPWDDSDDVMSTESNVSEDVLVRVKVRGWFTTSNPSGRERDASDPLNVLPQDRWVMPDDWGRLIGGTNDGAANYEERPEYDYVFGPASGLELDEPDDLIFPDDLGVQGDQLVDMWDAPMPPAPLTIDIRGAGFIKEVHKDTVYHDDAGNYPNPFYQANIPSHDILPAGNYEWNSDVDGPYEYWKAVLIGENISGNAGDSMLGIDADEVDQIRTAYDDWTIARRLVVYSDNHGEAMVAANGDLNLSYLECADNAIAGGNHCDRGDVVGSSDIHARADYPDLRGKHAPVNAVEDAMIDWTWGGYKEISIQDGETDQFKYLVFHAVDRDGFCQVPSGAVSLHPVLTEADQAIIDLVGGTGVGEGAQLETVDFLIDSDEGGIFTTTSDGTGPLNVTKEMAEGVHTYSTNDAPAVSFAPYHADVDDECQAWVRISNSLLGITNVLVIAHDDEGDVGFDALVDFQDEHTYNLTFRWSLVPWVGANNMPVEDALSGTGDNEGGDDIMDSVTAVYGWEGATQTWLAFFPDAPDLPGVNDLTHLQQGKAYWIAIDDSQQSISWTIQTNVN